MRYEQIKKTVTAVNTQFLNMGMPWDYIDTFWKECLDEVKTELNEKTH